MAARRSFMPVEEQLLMRQSPAGPEDADRAPLGRPPAASDSALAWRQHSRAEAVLHRQDPPAAGAPSLTGVVVPEDVARRAEPPGQHAQAKQPAQRVGRLGCETRPVTRAAETDPCAAWVLPPLARRPPRCGGRPPSWR